MNDEKLSISDATLIARLRKYNDDLLSITADRIEQLVATCEALVKERYQWIEHTKNAVWSDSEELKLANDRIEALVVAGRAYREATRHFKPCPETSANFDAALKGN